MIKNIIVSGCSFTSSSDSDWSKNIFKKYNPAHYQNLAWHGAGNYYISESVIGCLNRENFNPKETLILIMWSGYTRLDLQITEQIFQMLSPYYFKKKIYENSYVFSGGELGAWQKNALIKELFHTLYKTTNHEILAGQTLNLMLKTKIYLKHYGYHYKFLSFVNYWQDTQDLVSRMDHSLKIFDNVLYGKVLEDPNWIFVDDQKNCFYEFAKTRGLLSEDGFHPNSQAHQEFAEEIVSPNVKGYFF